MPFNYPDSIKVREPVFDNINGHHVEDPYRRFEDPKSDATKEFITQQNGLTEPFLNQCPHRQRIKEILTKNQDYRKIGCPFKRGNKYYFFMNEGLQPQSVLYQQDTLDTEPKVFFDPNTLSEDGTVALSTFCFSENGEYFAYGLSSSGSDWLEIGIKHVPSGEDLEEKLKRAKFTSLIWTRDNKGFFYSQYPLHKGEIGGTETEKNTNHSLFYHRLNTPQTSDVLKVDFPEHPNWNIYHCEVSRDGRYLHVLPSEGCNNNVWFYCDLVQLDSLDKFDLKPVYTEMENEFDYVSDDGDIVYFRTNVDARNYRLVKLDLKHPAKENWIDIITNHPEDVLDMAEIYTASGKNYVLVSYMRRVVYHLELHKLEGGLIKKFNTPLGTIAKYSGRRDDNEIFYQFTSFLTPGESYHFDLTNIDSEPRLLRSSKPKGFDPNLYQIEQVFYCSSDGVTRIPMFIVSRKDVVKDGSNPCILYGYGGFNIQITSAFNINRIAWLKNFKGILAVANIRGGGELGKKWHDQGRKLNKLNCFNDFNDAAKYLIQNKYTCPKMLASEGGSNGGLLVAAAANREPKIWGAMICHVGVLDMIRFHKFTIGYAWKEEYGDPEDEEFFQYMMNYSPYHNIPQSEENFPASLLLTADHDDRVVPAHSLKYIAQLQYKLGQTLTDTPFLIRVDTKAGHGAGRPISKVIDEYADIYSFLYNILNLKEYFQDD